MSHPDTHSDKAKPFSVLLFIFTICTSVAICLTTLAFVFPNVWRVQLQASWIAHVNVFLICHLMNGILEHPFHRYVLHSPLIPGLSKFYKSHTKHHGLTRVVWRRTGVENYYPIIEEKQHEASFFPWYSYLAFALVLTGPLACAQFIFSQAPIFLEGYLALAFSISLYEIFHAIEHKSLEKWIPKLEHPHPKIKKFWRTVYAFHLRHHVDIKCNEGISAFFGIPIADFLFGTWVNPNTLYEHGAHVDKKEFKPPTPIFFIRWLDVFAERQVQKRRAMSI